MPVLPLDHPEPFAATLGVMLYPGEAGEERRKAESFTAAILAEPIRRAEAGGHALSRDDLLRIASGGGAIPDDLDRRWWEATATGEVFKVLFALYCTDETLASWKNAIRIVEADAGRRRLSGSRTALMEARGRYKHVAHLWAAWCLREGRFEARPEVGYDLWLDFQSFLSEAETLRHWGQTWRAARQKAKPPLPADVWRVPDDWSPPERQPGWPDTGRVRCLALTDDQVADMRPAGRPKKDRR